MFRVRGRSWLLFVLICAFYLNCSSLGSAPTEPPGPCSGGRHNRTHRVEVEFKTQVVENEYIIQFDAYYQPLERAQFIRTALNDSADSSAAKWWRIVARNNPVAEKYASDFDVVQIVKQETAPRAHLDVAAEISRHPHVRSVTPQRIVQRSLKYVRVSEDEENGELGPGTGERNDGQDNGNSDDDDGVVDQEEDSEFNAKAEDLENDADLNDVILNLAQHMDAVQRQLKSERATAASVNDTANNGNRVQNRRLLRAIPRQITSLLKADVLWGMGITGRGIKVAVFDTGLAKSHPHFKRIKERTNWTNEKSLDDGVSHGTFVAGVIASNKECLGFAPDAELHIFRVFTNNQVSYTSWFLDAFNYAILKKINVLNLSIGGPDFLDQPFVDKVSSACSTAEIGR